MSHQTPGAWIGPAPSLAQSAAVIAVGITGVMIAGLQPQLLGALAREGRLSASQLGHAATGELLAMGLAAGLAGALLKPRRLRLIGLAAGLVLALLDLATTRLSGEAITLARAAAGVPSGVMIWMTVALIARAPRPERWSGVYLTLQTAAQFVLATILTAFVISGAGANGGWVALAGMSALAGLVALACPDRYAELHEAHGPGGLPAPRGLAALAACFLILAFIVGVWVYAEPLSRQAGHPPQTVDQAVSLSLAFQVAGGATATLLAGRLRWFWTMMACAALDVVLLATFASLPSPPVFLVASAAFGFLWLFLMPFLVPMAIEADPSRRAAVLLGGAQLLGGSLGPLLASTVVSDADARGALAFGAACLLGGMGLAIGLHVTRRRPVAAV
ncbi:MAG: MFS transporter [Phenylobacterium sp.]|uniref:MFS transporter n=1 Tax=Phenylobacterium sp. TaxID=1871053 RepID=UPI0025DFBD21|nr:MFS transporter [Phenylobacterium sp.]MBI1199764.1 MFS transporter [Phenylobacterium sp.]